MKWRPRANKAKAQLGGLILEVAKVGQQKTSVAAFNEEINTIELSLRAANEAATQYGTAAIATTIAITTQRKSFNDLDKDLQAVILRLAEARQKQIELNAVLGLRELGFSPQQAAALAAQNTLFEERNKKIRDGIEELKKYNAQSETLFQQQLEAVKQSAQATGDFVTFFTASMKQAATQGHTFWNDLETAAKGFVDNAKTALGDGFFALFNNNLEGAKEAFNNFISALKRELSNFLASQIVSQFLRLFGGGGASGAGGLFSAALSFFTGGGGGGGGNGGPIQLSGPGIAQGASRGPESRARGGRPSARWPRRSSLRHCGKASSTRSVPHSVTRAVDSSTRSAASSMVSVHLPRPSARAWA